MEWVINIGWAMVGFCIGLVAGILFIGFIVVSALETYGLTIKRGRVVRIYEVPLEKRN